MNKNLLNLVETMTTVELYEQLYKDPLTGCLNRRAFDANPPSWLIALVDLDSLKWVNDHKGYRAGDALIKEFADLLVEEFGADNVYRLGGDEFVVAGLKAVPMNLGLLVVREEFPRFSSGMGVSLESADKALKSDKAHRELIGVRAKRGEKPVWA